MNFNEYQKLALRTAKEGQLPGERLINAALGVTGEAGEFADIVKKWEYQGHHLNEEETVKELGDMLWYINLAADALGVSLGHVAQVNIDKLKKRFPDGFSAKASVHRIENYNK